MIKSVDAKCYTLQQLLDSPATKKLGLEPMDVLTGGTCNSEEKSRNGPGFDVQNPRCRSEERPLGVRFTKLN